MDGAINFSDLNMAVVKFLFSDAEVGEYAQAFRNLAQSSGTDLSFHHFDFPFLWLKHFRSQNGEDFGSRRGRNFYGNRSELVRACWAVYEDAGKCLAIAPLVEFKVDIRGRAEPIKFITFCADSVMTFYQDILVDSATRETSLKALLHGLVQWTIESHAVLFLGYIPSDSPNLAFIRNGLREMGQEKSISMGEAVSRIRPGAYPWNLPGVEKALAKVAELLPNEAEILASVESLLGKLKSQTSALMVFKATRLALEKQIDELANRLEAFEATRECAQAMRSALESQVIRYPRLILPDNEEAYWNGLSQSRRYWFKRYQKKFDAAGATFETVEPASLTEQDIEDYLRLHGEYWGTDSISINPGTMEFHRHLCRSLAAQGAFRLFFATHEGKRIVAHACIETGGRREYLFGGRSPESEELRAGKLLVNHTVVDAVRKGFRAYDFGYGGDEYKTEFTKDFRNAHNFFVAQRAEDLDLESLFPKMEFMVMGEQ